MQLLGYLGVALVCFRNALRSALVPHQRGKLGQLCLCLNELLHSHVKPISQELALLYGSAG